MVGPKGLARWFIFLDQSGLRAWDLIQAQFWQIAMKGVEVVAGNRGQERVPVPLFSYEWLPDSSLQRYRADYSLPSFMSVTRFSKAEVLTLSALPLAMAASATLRASCFLPAAQRMFAFAERLRNVSLTLIDWSTNFSASSQFLSAA